MSEDHSIIDYEEILNVLPESLQQTWKDNPNVLVYLSELGSLNLQRLTQEPDRLSEEKVAILEQTQDLAFHNYKTFIQAAECSQKIFQDFNIIETRLDSMLKKLPEFREKCTEFGKEAQQINARWHQASSTLAKHPQLLEFLEMPQLMDNYVKNENYDEALELSAYVKRLDRKHDDIPLIRSIVADVQSTLNVMLANLLTKLRTHIQLPECLKVVGYLRRMDVFNETELRIKFLQARNAWFESITEDIEKSDPYHHIIKIIETSRTHLFDIITQYRAIFSDDDPLLFVRGSLENYSAIFQSWIMWKVSWFLKVLEKDISYNLGGRIDSVLAQCMYFGLSFSRVNVDFRPLLVPIFQNATFAKFRSAVKQATSKFENSMQTYVITTSINVFTVPSLASENSLQPPNSLLNFYPLAQYCNNILGAFNELKLCISFSFASDVVSLLEDSLKCLIKKLLQIYTHRKSSMTEKEDEHFKKLCFHYSSDLVPHLNTCLSVLFPAEDISTITGVSSLEFKKIEHFCKIDVKKIVQPLEDIIPHNDDDFGLVLNFDKSEGSVENKDTKNCDNASNKELGHTKDNSNAENLTNESHTQMCNNEADENKNIELMNTKDIDNKIDETDNQEIKPIDSELPSNQDVEKID